jgi:hypothetical protein
VILNDPKKPMEEPQRVSNPNPNTPPMEAPSRPQTEYEKNVPHSPDQSVAMKNDGKGEGSYEGTKQYQDGYKKFSEETSPDDAVKKAEQINPNDPSLKQAEQRGKSSNGGTGGRISVPSIH